MDGEVAERHPCVLRLDAIDGVAQGPPSSCGALPVAGLSTESTAAARGDARDQDVVTRLDVPHCGAHFLDRADRFVSQDATRLHLRHVALEDVEVGSADGDRVDADDHVRVRLEGGIGYLLPLTLAGSVVDECAHGFLREVCRDDYFRRPPAAGGGMAVRVRRAAIHTTCPGGRARRPALVRDVGRGRRTTIRSWISRAQQGRRSRRRQGSRTSSSSRLGVGTCGGRELSCQPTWTRTWGWPRSSSRR